MVCRGELSIKAYVDKENFADELLHVYEKAGITILPVQGDKDARVHRMLVDIGLCELENRGQLNLMVISKNIKEETYFLSVVEHLSCYVLLALPHSLSSTMLPIVSFKWLNTSLFYGEIPTDHIGIFGLDHQLKSRKETVSVSDGLDRTQKLLASEIGLFWDIEDCQPDNVGNPDRLYYRTKSALWDLGYRGHLSIMVYVDMEKEDLCYTFQDSRIKLRVTQGGKYAKATKMLVDMLFWAMNIDVSSNLMLISKPSKDMKSDSVLQALEAKG